MMTLLALLLLQPAVTCEDVLPAEQAVSVTCMVPNATGIYYPAVEVEVPEDDPPPSGETDFLALPGATCWDFSDPAGLGVPIVESCDGDCVMQPIDDVSWIPGGIDGNGAVAFGPGGHLRGNYFSGGEPSVMAGFDDGGPITVIGFAHRTGNFDRNARLYDFIGGGQIDANRHGIMLVATSDGGHAIEGSSKFRAYTGYETGTGFRSWPVRDTESFTAPENETFCHGLSWSPGGKFRIYINGVEGPYMGLWDVVVPSRQPPATGRANISDGGTLSAVGWQDRLCKFQVDLTDAQHAEFCAQGGW